MTRWQALGNAVVKQAVDDWREATRILAKPHSEATEIKYRRMKDDCERFFNSDWFNRFTELDGKDILKKLEHEPLVTFNDAQFINGVAK